MYTVTELITLEKKPKINNITLQTLQDFYRLKFELKCSAKKCVALLLNLIYN